MIRNATINDLNEVRELVMMASALVFEDALNTKDRNKVNALFDLCYTTKNNKYSMENTIVYELDNKVVACLVYYHHDQEIELNTNMEQLVNNDYKLPPESYPNTLYLDTLAVSNDYRGLGLSRKLMTYIIDNSESDLSLLVETFKVDVQKYYERLGFVTVSTLNSYGSELDLMVLKK